MKTSHLPEQIKKKIKEAPVPVVYQEAVKAIAACRTIDESKYWKDKADALAAWAKIYKSEEAAVESRRLKLYAYKRLGELAEEIRPSQYIKNGRTKGAISLLKEHGFNNHQAVEMRQISMIPKQKFNEIVNAPKPLGTARAAVYGMGFSKAHTPSSAAYRKLCLEGSTSMSGFRSFTRKNNPKELAKNLNLDEAIKVKNIVVELQEWLDEFEQNLPR